MEETPLNSEFIDKLKAMEAETFPARQLDALKELQSGLVELTTVLTNGQDDDKSTNVETLDLLQGIQSSLESISGKEDAEIPDFAKPVIDALAKLQDSLTNDIGKIKLNLAAPIVNVDAPSVRVDAPKIDLSGIQNVLKTDIPAAFDKAISNIPEASPTDMSPLLDAFAQLQNTLDEVNVGVRLKPQSPSTMKVQNLDGTAIVPLKNGSVPVVNPDGTNIGGGSGGGTQYTDGDVAATHPVGTQPVFTDGSGNTRAVSTTNPLPIAGSFSATVTNDGTFAKETGGNLDAIKTDVDKIPSQGQALAAASMPIVLTAAQITTLTPPAAITGFATQTTLAQVKTDTDNLDVALSTRLKPADTLTKVATVDTITNPVAVTVSDGADVSEGATTDAAVAAGAAGSVSAKLRRLSTDIGAVKISVASLDTKTTAVNTGAVTISSSALPSGAATSSLQTTGNTSLSSIDTKLSGTLSTTGPVSTLSAVVNVGQTTSNTSAVQLSAVSTVPTNGIIVQALSGNTASVFIGSSGVSTSTGFELQAGQAAPFTANLNSLYVIGANNTDKVCWDVA